MNKSTQIAVENILKVLNDSTQPDVLSVVFNTVEKLPKKEIPLIAHVLFENQKFIDTLFVSTVPDSVACLFKPALLTMIKSLNKLSEDKINKIIDCIESLKKQTSPVKKYCIRYIYSALMLYNTKIFPTSFIVKSIKRLVYLGQMSGSRRDARNLTANFFRFMKTEANTNGVKIFIPPEVVRCLDDSTLTSLIEFAIDYRYETELRCIVKPLIDIHPGSLKQRLQSCKYDHHRIRIKNYLYLIDKNNIDHHIVKVIKKLGLNMHDEKLKIMEKIFALPICPKLKTELILFFDKHKIGFTPMSLKIYVNEIPHYHRMFKELLKSLQGENKNLSPKTKKGGNNVIGLPFGLSSNQISN